MNEWRPIDTHPRNDDDTLLLLPGGEIIEGYWRDDAQAFDSNETGWLQETPTHWKPLPVDQLRVDQ